MKETGLTGKRRSTTIAATPDDSDALKGTFKCVTIKRACFRWCGMIQYSALVNRVF